MSVLFGNFGQFRRLVGGRVNREDLVDTGLICRKTLSVKFKVFFDKPISPTEAWRLLPPKLTTSNNPWVLGIDGKWLRRKGVVMIYRDITHKENLFWSFRQSESYEAIHSDFERLVKLLTKDHPPSGVVSDWKGSIVNAASNFLPKIPHQRCLAHVVREAKRLLPLNSPLLATRVLRKIAKQLPTSKPRR